MNWTPNLPASLFRFSEAEVSEEIGAGTLAKMARIALSDPDNELWRYSINSYGKTITGTQIAVVAKH